MPPTAPPAPLRDVLTDATVDDVRAWLTAVPRPADRTRQLAKLNRDQVRQLGELLDPESAEDLLDSIDDELAARGVEAMAPNVAAPLVETLDSDHASDILRLTKPPVRAALLSAMSAERAAALGMLLEWPKDSAAAHMVPEVLTVVPDVTVSQAIAAVRANAAALRNDSRIGSYIYVIDDDRHLLGVVAFRDLVLTVSDEPISALMNDDLLWISPLTDIEEAAQALDDYQLAAVPVVDEDRRLLGILTESHAADIAEQEATEDAERQGGSEPLEVPYSRASPFRLWRKRIVWLLLLFVAEAYTGTVLRHFEEEMEAVVALAFFIPLLIGTGGNTGTQITTTLVRALATGDVRFRDVPTIIAKELSTGALIGLTMALAAVIRAWTLGVGPEVTLCVSLTVGAIVLWSSFIASILPPLLKKMRLDPALVSAPAIATIVDGTGLIIYFWIAHLTLAQLQGL